MSTETQPAASSEGPVTAAAAAMTRPPSVRSYFTDYFDKVRGGDIGALPAILGLIVLGVVFGSLRSTFIGAGNFANLLTQGASIAVIAMGLVFVMLLGEIDLSAGFASGVCASVLAILLSPKHNVSLPVALAAALATGLAIGLLLGTLVARVGIPSFVVTLAAFLAFQGIVLIIVGEGGVVTINDDVIKGIANDNMAPALGWALWAVSIIAYAALLIRRAASRRAKGLTAEPIPVVAARIGALAAITGAAVFILNQERAINRNITSLKGVPYVVPLIVVLLVVLTFVLNRTSYGRHIYAVGGNAEAARRAGINVKWIRTSVFVIGSTMAAIGGIIAASRASSVDPNAGGGNTLLYAVGAAVIGGTSLFGGKGKVRDAILGAAVVAVIANGMGLLGYKSGVQFIVTGLVLLIAASVDALSRRRSAATGKI
ncbi:MAG: ABC transporter permease [Mycobacteriales bacterium]